MNWYRYRIFFASSLCFFLGTALPVNVISAQPVWAQTPKALVQELNRWIEAVNTGSADRIAALLGNDEIIRVRFRGHPTLQSIQVNRNELRKRLERGEANTLGLSKLLLLPRLEDMQQLGEGRYSFTDQRCPEVTWIFALKRGKWRLIEIVRRFLEC
jgi:hypothetical protein